MSFSSYKLNKKINNLLITKERELVQLYYDVLNVYASKIPDDIDPLTKLRKLDECKIKAYCEVMVNDERVKMLQSKEYNKREKELIEKDILKDIKTLERSTTFEEKLDLMGLSDEDLIRKAMEIINSSDRKASAKMIEFLIKLKKGYLIKRTNDDDKHKISKEEIIEDIMRKLEIKELKVD